MPEILTEARPIVAQTERFCDECRGHVHPGTLYYRTQKHQIVLCSSCIDRHDAELEKLIYESQS